MDLMIETLGIIAGAITSLGFIPQLIRGYKTKKLEDISYYMPGILAIGMSLWLFYGMVITAFAVIIANAFGIFCCLTLISLKKKYS